MKYVHLTYQVRLLLLLKHTTERHYITVEAEYRVNMSTHLIMSEY